MKKLATTTAATATAVTMLAGLTGASTSSGAASTTTPDRPLHVKRLVLHSIESHSPAPNQYLGVDRLRSLATHEIAGYDNFAGVGHPKTDSVHFWLAVSLEGGMVDSVFTTPNDATTFTGRITHGYGRYRGAEGTIEVRIADSGRTVYILRYRL